MKVIFYVGFYDHFSVENEKRSVAPSGKNKMDYVVDLLSHIGYRVNILSPSWTSKKTGIFSSKKIDISKNVTLDICPTIGGNILPTRFLRKFIALFWLFIKLLTCVSENDQVIVYHSMDFVWPVLIAKSIKKFKLILEIEEIYQDLHTFSIFRKKSEYFFFKTADKYLFSNDLLNIKINKDYKPKSVIYGSYKIPLRIKRAEKNDIIHVVYSGTFDPRKGGALTAIAVSEYLTSHYHVHIIGFGSQTEIQQIRTAVKVVSQKTSAKITYDGLFIGKEYTNFLQNCSIGLSTQTPNAEYNNTSFPSKILSYMANGLCVVSAKLSVIEFSPLKDCIHYYENHTPVSIAKAILNINNFDKAYQGIELLQNLEKNLLIDFEIMLKS